MCPLSIDFANGREWWKLNVLYERIVESIPSVTERDEEVKTRLSQAFGAGGLDLADVGEGLRNDMIEALLRGVGPVIEATEPQAGTEDGDRDLTHLRELRDTALSARAER